MGTPHKHRDVIIAWANGEEIEYRRDPSHQWSLIDDPSWVSDYEYRIKPKRVKKEGWVNVYRVPEHYIERVGILSNAYLTKEDADAESSIAYRVACIRIEWEEEV